MLAHYPHPTLSESLYSHFSLPHGLPDSGTCPDSTHQTTTPWTLMPSSLHSGPTPAPALHGPAHPLQRLPCLAALDQMVWDVCNLFLSDWMLKASTFMDTSSWSQQVPSRGTYWIKMRKFLIFSLEDNPCLWGEQCCIMGSLRALDLKPLLPFTTWATLSTPLAVSGSPFLHQAYLTILCQPSSTRQMLINGSTIYYYWLIIGCTHYTISFLFLSVSLSVKKK